MAGDPRCEDSIKSMTELDDKKFSVAEFIFVKIPYVIMGSLILIGVAINFSNVISRYVFGNALFWVEEILVFMVIWSVFIGIASIAYKGAHLKMDLVSAHIGNPWKTIINGIMVTAFILCCVFVILQSYEVVSLMGRLGQVSVAASVPMIIPHAALLIGFGLMILAVIIRIRSYFTGNFDMDNG
jgi:TRAP-type C4-dicarboxylate transport system permease small subunit